MRVALILEGQGDVLAFPGMVRKIALQLREELIATNPIKTGGYHALKKAGQLERFVEMAARRPGVELVLIAVDLDDGCAAEERRAFERRCAKLSAGLNVDVRVAFCVREYECWFLENVDQLRVDAPEYNWDPSFVCSDPVRVRDAKGVISAAIRQHYKPTIDQLRLTMKLDLRKLYERNRSFRRFARALCGIDYEL